MKNLIFLSKAFVTMLTLLSGGLSAFAHDFYVNGIYYNYLDETAKTVEVTYKGYFYDSYSNEYTGSVTIPSSVTYNSTTYSVTSIGSGAFENCTGLTSVTIPNSVTWIGSEAFSGCTGLTEVNISDLSAWCKIDFGNYDSNPLYYAKKLKLNGIEIKDLVIPNDITEIKDYAFYNCDELTSVTIGNSVTSISRSAFSGCDGLTSVTIGNSVTSIGNCAFYYCPGLTSVTIPNSVTTIGIYAFEGCTGLTSVTIGNSVTLIGSEAFSGCTGLTEVNISDLSAWCKIDFGNYDSNPLYYAKKLKLNGTDIKNLVIPNDITKIKEYTFRGCSGLTSVTIPNSVTSIGDKAFLNTGWYNNQPDGILYLDNCCLGYKGSKPRGTLILNDGTRVIADYAFYRCTGLTSVTIPNSVTSIGDKAFCNCPGLTSVTIGNSVTSIGDYAFFNCTGLTSVTIPNSVTSIGDYAFYNCSGLTEVNISDLSAWCKINFGDSCANPLYYAKKLKLNGTVITNLVIPNDITQIKKYAFYNCNGLTSITIPNSVTKIGNEAFYNTGWYNNQPDGILYWDNCCLGYKGSKPTGTLILNDETRVIADYAFYNCTGLTNVKFPNSVANIGDFAFYGTSITDILLGIKIKSLSETALPNGTTHITFTSVPPKVIEDNTVEYISNVTLVVPTFSVDAYASHSFWGRAKKIIANSDYISQIPDGLYFAEKDGNICYYDMVNKDIVDTYIPAGSHSFQLASWNGAIYGVNAGEQYCYINDKDNTLGDGELYIVGGSENGLKKMTIVNNKNLGDGKDYQANLDPFHIMIDDDNIYYTNRTFSGIGDIICGVKVLPTQEAYCDTPYISSADVPIFTTANRLPYYGRTLAYGAIHAGLQRDSEGVYWHAFNYNGNGIYRYNRSDIYANPSAAIASPIPYPVIAEGIEPSAMFLDEKNDYIYIFNTNYNYHGVYRMHISTIRNGGDTRFPNAWELIDNSPASPENNTSCEGVYVRQFTSDGDYVYWAYIAAAGSGNKSGIKRVNATGTPIVEYVVEDVEAYGICSHQYNASNGIDVIEVDDSIDAVEIARYDIYGRLLLEPTKGINIVKYSDGTTKKFIIKN